MSNFTTFVGFDTHMRQTHAGVFDKQTGEVQTKRITGPPEMALGFLKSLPGDVCAVYEAGATGFGLARRADAMGLNVRICAPGSIPKKSNDRVKTDRRDALRLARQLAAGELDFVRVPTLAEEELRDLIRAREDLRGDLMRARHRLSKFLLRRERRFEGPGSNWTANHIHWLERLSFDQEALHVTYADYLASVMTLMQRRQTLDKAICEFVPGSPWAETIARLRTFRGIDTLTAAGICAEVGDFHRFAKPYLLAGYLGITPSEYTSDTKRRQGSITKTGSTHARRLLVEAAHHYRFPPRVTEALKTRQRDQDPRACEIAWRAQHRVHSQWQKLRLKRRKPYGVTVVACARELSTFIWEAAVMT